MPNPIVHFEIQGNDGPGIQNWYDGVFGWNIDRQPMPGPPDSGLTYGLVSAQDGRGIGGGVSASMDGQPHVNIYIEVDDPQAYLDKIVQTGGKIVMPVMEVTETVTLAMFTD